jgi:CRISPR-associated protein Cmr2
MSNSNYLALSIGPIYSTIQQARKTRELWASSFLFSKLMEFLIEQLKNKVEILSPLEAEEKNKPLYGAGIYPDRLYARVNKLDSRKIESIKEKAIEKLRDILLPDYLTNKKEEAFEFWKSYIRIVHVFKEIDHKEENVLFTLNEYLDTLELQPTFFEVEPKRNYLTSLLENPYTTKLKAYLKEKERGAYNGLMSDKGLFPSTADIATVELFKKDPMAYNSLREKVVEKKNGGERGNKKEKDNEDNLEEFYTQLFQPNKTKLSYLPMTITNISVSFMLMGILSALLLKSSRMMKLLKNSPFS